MGCLYIHNGNYYTERQLLEKFNSTSERVNSARDWLLLNTNMNSEELIIVNGLLNNDSLGRMLNDGKIIISNLAPDSLIYHEAFHRIFNLFATDSDRFKLIDEFKQRKDSSKLIDEMDKIYNSPNRIKIRGTVLSKEDLIEEILAEEFREYKIERNEKNLIKKTIFSKILDFISKILKLGKKIENQSFANEFYQKINEGFYASSPKLQNRINNYKDSLSDIKELKLIKGKTLGIEKTLDIVYSIHHEIINHLIKEELYYDLIDGSLNNDLFMLGFTNIHNAIEPNIASSMRANLNLIKANYYSLLKEYKIEKGEELELFNDKLFGDDKSKDTEFNKNSIEFDPRTSQRQAVRLLVSSLVSNEKNSIGQPKIIPIKQVVNLLLTSLSNVPPTIEDFTYTLNKLSNKHPYVSQILDILNFASEKGNTRLINDFIASFNNAFVGFDKLITIGGAIEIANANDLTTRDQVISTWKQNLIDNINTNRDLIPTLENFTIKNDRDANKFFKLLGIVLNSNYTNLKGYAQSIQKTIIDKKNDTKKSITPDQLLTLFNFKKDNNFFIDRELGNNFNVISFLSDFAKEEQKNMDDISIMLFNAENKPIYPVTQYHYLSMVVNWMNYYKNRHLDEKLEISLKDYLSSKMPYLFNYNTESSYWLKAFLVQNGLKMDLSLMSGIDLGLDNRLDFANAADYDYYSVALKLFEQGEANMYSKTLSITQGDRQIMPVFQIKEIVNDSNKYNIFKGYVKSELKRLYLNKKDGLEHMIGFNSEKGNSLISKDIVNIDKLFKSLKIEDSIDDAIDELLDSIDLNKNLDNHIEKNTNKYEQIFKDMHVKVPKGTYSSQREFIENWYINTYFNNIEQFKLFYGDSSIFRTYSNLWKRLNTPTSTGTPSIASEELLDELDALDNNYTFEGFSYVENKINNGASKNTIKEQFLKDVETSSSTIDFIENKFREYYTNIYSIIPWKDKFSSYFGNETPNLEKLIEEEVKRDSAPYKKIKEADGFSYVNLFEWRRIMKTFALWTPKHDNLFNQEFEILKISMDNRLNEIEKERAFNEIMSNGYLTLDEYFDDFSQSSLLKPQYSGVVYYKSYEDYVNTPIGERANIYGIRKTSFMPLMPSVIFNTNLEVLHNKMLSSGTGITFYDSAAKDGRSDLAHDVNELIDSSENQLETLNGDFSTYLDYQFLKNQVYINTDEKTKIIDSTQSRKQIITDKYHKNIPFDFILNNKELGFGNIENKWNSLSELEKEQQSDLHKTVNEYITFTNKVLERNKNFLLKEFEIAANKDLTEFELENVNQIIKLLKQAAIDRNNSLDIIDSFQYLLESSESTLFNVFPNPTKLQSLITSIVTNNVIKTKRLGNDYAQVSPVMWEKRGQKRINNSKTNNELLKSYSDLSPSEIMIPAPKDLLRKIEKLIIKKDPKIMESYNKFKDKYTSSNIKLLVEILNDLVDTGYLGSEVTLKGLRIPNQELSSNDVFKIKKFLLPTMSKFVVVNAELIAKTGSDFDIDKLNLYFKYLNSNLKEIVYSEDNSEEATKERFDSFKQQELEDLLDYFTDKNIEQISQKLKEIKESKKELYDLNKNDLEKLFSQKEIYFELKDAFFDKLNEGLEEQLEEINTYNNTDFFNLKLNTEQLENISKVTNLFEYRDELYKIRINKLNNVSTSLYTLMDNKDRLNKELNIAFEKLTDKRKPFNNISFKNIHDRYLKSKEDLETFLKNIPNGYPEVNVVLQQVHQRIQNVETFYNEWKNAKVTKNNLTKELIDNYFSEIESLKIEEKSLKNLEYELFKTLPVGEQNSMGAIFNKLSEIEQKLILSPLSMANLLHPIGDGGLEELLVSKLEKNVKKEERFSVRESKELSEAVEPENNLIKKNDMKEANIGIAQMATHGTGHAISKKTVISPSFWSSNYKIDLNTELLFEGFENNNDISSSFTQDSENIAQLISGHLTSQVDAASNPYAIYLNIRSSVNPISMYLLRRGVNKEIVYRFLIQPSILEFIKRRDIYTSPLYKNLNYRMSKKGGDILAIKDLEAIIGNPIIGEGMVLKKKDVAMNMQNLKSISIKDLKDKSSLEDKSFQKNALFYFLALREQARLFSDYKKLMSSDTDYHKSLNSYQELSFIYEELKKSNFITNLDEMLNTGFIGGFTKAAKLYYYPWKSLFLGHRDFASHTNSYLNSYVNILSENLGFSRSEERKAKLKESMERQLFIYILNNYVNTSKLNPIEVLELGAKSIKAFNINKVLTIDKDYGEVSLKEDIIKSKAKSFHTFELNNYLVFMQKINSLEAIKIGDDIITGKEFLKQLYIQSLKQSKNDFSPNDISNIIPGRVKMELLTEIMNKFLEMEKNGKINSNFFANFMVQFQLNNERYILSSPIGHLLGRGEENTIVDSQLNEYFLKGNYYTSDFNSFNTEIVEDTSLISSVKENIEKLNTVDLSNNNIKNLYFLDVASKDTVNGKKSFINKTKIDFEESNVYLIPQDVFVDGILSSISRIKIGTFENDELGNFHLKIDLSENISQQTTEQPINKEIKPNEYTNHSGGAEGSDIQWDKIGKEFGFVNNNHYWTETKTPHGNIEITKEDFEEGRYESAKAAKRNFGYQYAAMKDSRLIRNWSQVKHSDAVFAIGKIVRTGEKLFPNQTNDTRVAINPSVTGGTGYAVGMAINHNKPTYVFNQTKGSYEIGWYKWNNNSDDFVKVETPTLTKNFAGIGTREINDLGKQAIKDVYQKILNPPTEIKPKIDSSKKIESLKRGDIINFQQQEFLVERVKNEGIDVRDVNTGDVDFISTEDYINETQEQPIVEENVTNNQNTQEQGKEFTPEDLGLNTNSNQNDAVCK